MVEILVAMVVLAIVLTIAYRVFSGSYSALQQVNPHKDLHYTARTVLDRMADEIHSAYYGPGLSYAGFIGENDEKEDAPWDSLTFSAMANFYWIEQTEGIKESDFLKISYYLVEDEEETDKRRLIRRQDPGFGPFEENPEELDTGLRGVQRLTDNVWGMDARYFDGAEWVEEWNSEDRERLPRAVEIKLILQTSTGKRLPFYAVIPIEASN